MIFVDRAEELALLQERLCTDGLTVVVARPLMGKTTLLQHCLKALGESVLVGWSESTGEHSDLLLRAIADLYSSWLSDATYREHAISLWRRRQTTTMESVAQFVSSVLESAKPLPGVGVLTKALESLVESSQHLKQGAVLPRLSYDQASELLSLVRDLSERRIVLVLDNFERSPDLLEEQRSLITLLRRGELRGVHLVVLSRDQGEGVESLRELSMEAPTAKFLELGLLTLRLEDQHKLLEHLRSSIPPTRLLNDAELLSLVDGYPGVLHWWLDRPDGSSLRTVGDLVTAAIDAHANSYRNLGSLLRSCSNQERLIAARIALLPPLTLASPSELVDLVRAGFEHELQQLQAKGVLDPARSVPCFGHPTRHEAAHRLFIADAVLKHAFVLEARKIIDQLGQSIDAPPTFLHIHAIALLAYLESVASSLELAADQQAACRLALAHIRLPFEQLSPEGFLRDSEFCSSMESATVAAFVLTGVLDEANLDPRRTYHRPILERLRELLRRFPNPKMRRLVAGGHRNALNYDLVYDDRESSQEIIAYLRQLADSYPDEQLLQEVLVGGLVQAIGRELGDDISNPALLQIASLRGAKEYKALVKRVQTPPTSLESENAGALNDELRRRAQPYLDRKPVRDWLLTTILRWIRWSPDPDLEHEHGQLRQIRDRFSDSALVWGLYAEGTYHCLARDLLSGRLDRRDHWLNLLREVAQAEEYLEVTDHWLFLALIDAADFTAMITEGAEDKRPFLQEIDDRIRKQPAFRAAAGRHFVGLILRFENNPAPVERLLVIFKSMMDDFPNDASLREYATVAVGVALKQSIESKTGSNLMGIVMRDYESFLPSALEALERKFGRRMKKRVRSQMKKWARRKRAHAHREHLAEDS